MKKKILIILGAVLLVIITIISIILLNGAYFKSKKDLKDYDNNSWMNYLSDQTLLIDAIIPGSHDAGTFNMSYLGKTQGYSVEDQLKMGARYFDLRVNKTDGGYYMFHSVLNGEKFENVLCAITSFISKNPSETLILDFQHFKGGSANDVADMLQRSLFDNNLAVKNDTEESDLQFISQLKLSQTRGKCVVLFGGNEDIVANSKFIFARNNDECTKFNQTLNSCYISEYNKSSSKFYIQTAIPFYYQNINDKIATENFKGLFVLQGQLTDGYLIFGPYSKEKSHNKNMTEYIKNLKNNEKYLSLTNVIMRDFLTTQKCEDIFALNYFKGNVKKNLVVEFQNKFVK